MSSTIPIRRKIVEVKIKGGGSWKRYFVKFGHIYRFPGVMSAELTQVGKTLRCRDCEFLRESSER